jgi:cell wall-associated NlpC family hydrolase
VLLLKRRLLPVDPLRVPAVELPVRSFARHARPHTWPVQRGALAAAHRPARPVGRRRGRRRRPAGRRHLRLPAAVAVGFALRQLGKPYRWGADGPRSYDCSGLVQTAYRAAGVNLPRVSRQQYHAGRHVRLTALRAGDLLFYADDPRDPRTIGHVGM